MCVGICICVLLWFFCFLFFIPPRCRSLTFYTRSVFAFRFVVHSCLLHTRWRGLLDILFEIWDTGFTQGRGEVEKRREGDGWIRERQKVERWRRRRGIGQDKARNERGKARRLGIRSPEWSLQRLGGRICMSMSYHSGRSVMTG